MSNVCRVTYVATNLIDGERHEGSASDLSKILKVSIDRIYHASSSATLIAEMWEIAKAGSDSEARELNKSNFPYTLLLEWDKVTQPFKELSRRKAERIN